MGDSSGSKVSYFMVGLGIGALVGILFAPKSGEETREYLGQKAREGRARARDAVDQGREVYRQQRDTLTTAVDRGREAFQQARTNTDGQGA